VWCIGRGVEFTGRVEADLDELVATVNKLAAGDAGGAADVELAADRAVGLGANPTAADDPWASEGDGFSDEPPF
jgi:hypothetical protein